MYRVIFLFDIGDLLPSIGEAIERLQQRQRAKDPEASCQPLAVLVGWFRRVLREDLQMLLLDHYTDRRELFDAEFLNENLEHAARVYRQVAPAILHHSHPCVESWCAVHVQRNTLYLTFDVGPIDYGARHTEDFPPCI